MHQKGTVCGKRMRSEPEEEGGAAILLMAGVLLLGGRSCKSKESPPLLFVLLMMMMLQCTASVAASAVGFQKAETLTGHSNAVYAVSFSHDSSLLASGSSDATTIIYNVLQPECNGLPDPIECQTTYKDKCSSADLGNLARKQCPAMCDSCTPPTTMTTFTATSATTITTTTTTTTAALTTTSATTTTPSTSRTTTTTVISTTTTTKRAAVTTTPNAEPSTVCGVPDAERGTNTCNGNLYDFSQIQPSNGKIISCRVFCVWCCGSVPLSYFSSSLFLSTCNHRYTDATRSPQIYLYILMYTPTRQIVLLWP